MKVGVVIGRFQTPYLHKGHQQFLLNVSEKNNDTLVIFIGQSRVQVTTENPLPFNVVVDVIKNSIILSKTTTFLPLHDKPTDEQWTESLDIILTNLYPGADITIYGSKDSCIPHYKGKFKTEIVPTSFPNHSSTDIRKQIGNKSLALQCCEGAIWATQNRFPVCFPTVDVAIINYNKVLLARKPNEKLFRFPGGFAEPDSISYESDANREAREETGLEISNVQYLSSFKIDDWRYRRGKDKIKTLFFTANYTWGAPVPSDDLEGGELKWFDIASITRNSIMPEHLPLFDCLLTHFFLERHKYVQVEPNS